MVEFAEALGGASELMTLEECMDAYREQRAPILLSSYIMVGILAVLFLPAALFVTYRICRFVWSSDKIIPLMLIMLTCTVISMLSYYIFLIC